jgi:hypothetical protein
MEKISVVINTDGSFEYAVAGVKGSKCRDLTKALDALANVVTTKNTGEYCEMPVANQQKAGL